MTHHRSLRSRGAALLALVALGLCLGGATGALASETLRGTININTATAEQLEMLPGIGASRAQAVIEARKRAGGFKRVDDLLALANRDPGIVAALIDEQRHVDTLHLVQRRDALQMGAHIGIALVAIFLAAQVAPVRLRAFEEGDEVGYAKEVDACPQPVRVVDQRRQAHVTTVGASVDGHA